MKKYLSIVLILTTCSVTVFGQDKGVFSGNFQSNFSVFLKDSLIGATEAASPQYGKQISSSEAWLFLNYDVKGYHFAARYDLFNNSNLLNPSGAFTGQGLGFWQIKKSIGDLELTAGSFYDQFGSGAAFRAFENRLIGIDYAMEGVRAKYNISDNFAIKAFTGKQKGSQDERFETSPQIIKGINAEKGFSFDDGTILNLGASGVNRTLDENTMSQLVTEINGLSVLDRFYPKYNVYVMNGYFNMSYKDFGFNGEYNYKTSEAIRDNEGTLYNSDGSLILGGINYSKRKLGKEKKAGIGVNVQYRRIENFPLTVSPYENLLNGIVTYQPSMSRQASYRMLARYQAPAQFTGEQAYQAELIYSFNKKSNITLNYSDITDLSGERLFSEKFVQLEHKINRKWKGKVGLQMVEYNQPVYEGKDPKKIDNVETLTPFFEVTYKVNRKNSIRLESQMLNTEQDLGSFYHGILEWNSSPHFSVAISDMVNTNPVRIVNPTLADQVLHYPSLFVKYNIKTTSFTAAYVKQVEGINCTGGICRLEPAFSGLRFTLSTQF
ncbi:MAG: DUF6029 family protein [Bacteroidia bacterium]